MRLGDRGDQEIGRLRAAMLAPGDECRLCASSERLSAPVERQRAKTFEPQGDPVEIGLVARRVEEFEGDRRAQRELVFVDQARPSLSDLVLPVPGTCIGQKDRHLRRAEPPQFLRVWADAPAFPDVIHQITALLAADDLVERSVDRVGDRLGAEDLARLRELLAVDDH